VLGKLFGIYVFARRTFDWNFINEITFVLVYKVGSRGCATGGEKFEIFLIVIKIFGRF
jgi:hypothetical protein